MTSKAHFKALRVECLSRSWHDGKDSAWGKGTWGSGASLGLLTPNIRDKAHSVPVGPTE